MAHGLSGATIFQTHVDRLKGGIPMVYSITKVRTGACVCVVLYQLPVQEASKKHARAL